jgi:hypothetical protein
MMLYTLTNGASLWTEGLMNAEAEGGPWYIFDTMRTLIILPRPDGTQQWFKAHDSPGHPTTMRVPATAILTITDITDSGMLTKFKATLSGLVIAQR